MSYDPHLYEATRLVGARLGTEFRLGSTRLGAADQHIPLDFASVTIADGFTRGTAGELSIDPTVCTATVTDYLPDPVAVGTLALAINDRVQVAYASVVQFIGAVTGVSVVIGMMHGGRHSRQITYTIASRESQLLAASVSWSSLPAESALTRLQRWFTTDTSGVATAHLPAATVTVPADPNPGTADLLTLARAFSAATLLPVRPTFPLDPSAGLALSVFDGALSWSDQIVTVAPGLTTSADWTQSVKYSNLPGSAAVTPDSITVVPNDMRLAGGQLDAATTTPSYLGTTLRLGTSRTGTSGVVQVGFLAGMAVDVFGSTMIASRVVQTYGLKRYTASLELAAPLIGS